MSEYTTEIRWIVEKESGIESGNITDINNAIRIAAPKIFNFDFPIFDEAYRLPLETKILRHYYTREISEETVALWKLRLQDSLCMIMPYYNQLYKSELLQFNPLYDVDVTTHRDIENNGNTESKEGRTGTYNKNVSGNDTRDGHNETEQWKKNDGENKNTDEFGETNNRTLNENIWRENNSNGKQRDETRNNDKTVTDATTKTDDTVTTENIGKKWDLYSDTPQGGINGIEHEEDNGDGNGSTTNVGDNYYLTNARKITNNENDTVVTDGLSHSVGTQTDTKSGTNIMENEAHSNDHDATNSTIKNERGGQNVKTYTIDETEHSNENKKYHDGLDRTENTEFSESENKNRNDKVTNMEEYVEHITGKRGTTSFSRMMLEFRETFLNIDKQVIDELSDLFFGLW